MNALPLADLADLLGRLLVLSLLSIGGAMATAPELHRYLVDGRGWLDDATFSSAVALAQAAPGPNVLFVPLLGYQLAGLTGAFATLAGILLPSTLLSLSIGRWARAHRHTAGARAFTAGLAPVAIGLLLATGWLIARPYLANAGQRVGTLALIAITLGILLKTRVAPIWLLMLGALAGLLGLA
ncbi:chromate transporter [Pseudothauera nasutitermitis]|uniref:Chromate transporter n=1 Tax=Pseudothauera nasutitermitis TaxID=2565930 RepID=A0A4S4B1T7_9RHOO|nr:chromate transporter [Pseudothauera nasutitermitis]THF66522.1 chromate transporter [Pseudothauera nasutitermitis]